MIAEASPEFYLIIKDCQATDLPLLAPKEQLTIYKYFNRARYRATPFGRFASLTLVPHGRSSRTGTPIILAPPVYHTFVDWSFHATWEAGLRASGNIASQFQANRTIYLSGTEIKYIFFNGFTFELSSVPYNPFLYDLLLFVREPRGKPELLSFIKNHKGDGKTAAKKLIAELISIQLILDDYSPNITGPDYFKRHRLPAQVMGTAYTIAERQWISGEPGAEAAQQLNEAIGFLNAILPLQENNDVKKFRDGFLERFGDREVPLSAALDPETGPGYGGLESGFHTHETMINEIKALLQNTNGTDRISYGELQQFLLSSWQERPCIRLESFQPGTQKAPALPNTLSAVTSFADDLLVCEHIGGNTANAMLGRFSLLGGGFEAFGRNIAETEEAANPGVIFFDVAYRAEDKIDNVNRRGRLYPFEFCILSYSTGDKNIELDDLQIAVRQGEIILRSKKLNRRVVPRIASAYNYVRSDLSLFRFLADLQQQQIRSSLRLDLRAIFPGLSRYPRVQFKKVILSPARWLVPDIFRPGGVSNSTEKLRQWLHEQGIGMFSYGNSDQKLTFRAHSDTDLEAFLAVIKNKTGIYITEYIPLRKGIVGDKMGKAYNSEFIYSFYHTEQIYAPITVAGHSPEPAGVKKYFLPGQEWLYFEIYCHHIFANLLLTNHIARFITENRQKIVQWFFIRYNSPSHHIRLRVKLEHPREGYLLMNALSLILEASILSGQVKEFLLKPYLREVERYGTERIDLAEKFFFRDSTGTLRLMARNVSAEHRYYWSIRLLDSILLENGYEYAARLAFYAEMEKSFASEFGIIPAAFRKINDGFAAFSEHTKVLVIEKLAGAKRWKELRNAFNACVRVTPQHLMERMIADLFHMHVNRMFETDQRMHEMIIYIYLQRLTRRRYYTERNGQLPV
ncbi:lantibiotic dehydratase [Mucilaginibacter sp. SJ]|uniref:lantibiotic dehydratase n=1 Tax=Mucilaginibacter sp. SJ TaxID=3029053 RepID=UPI0023AA0C27|nr:lantibiotic dehydratase [Mucilaginibacter sp. SJ]WEA03856.1 thiopeptide-type bacteriocin biosynthesis protein [Mucilaginibacter sp. SJ]